MRALLLSFSPCGTTGQVADMVQKSLQKSRWTVHREDLAGHPDLFPQPDYPRFLGRLPAHDLLVAAGPVYIDHLQYHLLDLLRALPWPDQHWGRFAALIATFGKVSPGIALAEGAKVLSLGQRSILAGLEADCTHCLSRHLPTCISPTLPGPEMAALVDQLVSYLTAVCRRPAKKQPNLNLMLQTLFDRVPQPRDERQVLRDTFPAFVLDPARCNGCLQCVRGCPVRHLEVVDGHPVPGRKSECIHCTHCLSLCPRDAIRMDLTAKEQFLQNALAQKHLDPQGPSESRLFLP